MSRRFTEVVHVGVQDRRPAAFRWRGNRYVVHEVLGHWRERRPWWTGGSSGGWSRELSEEYEVWRVEASRSCGGLNAVTGVYDLCLDAGARPDTGVWRLLRVVD